MGGIHSLPPKERAELRALLESQGYSWQQLPFWPAKATYYKRTGEAMPNLPSDPYSMRAYLKKGFMLAPPSEEDAATYIFSEFPELLELVEIANDERLQLGDEQPSVAIEKVGPFVEPEPLVSELVPVGDVAPDIKAEPVFGCKKCGYLAKSKAGLKVHEHFKHSRGKSK